MFEELDKNLNNQNSATNRQPDDMFNGISSAQEPTLDVNRNKEKPAVFMPVNSNTSQSGIEADRENIEAGKKKLLVFSSIGLIIVLLGGYWGFKNFVKLNSPKTDSLINQADSGIIEKTNSETAIPENSTDTVENPLNQAQEPATTTSVQENQGSQDNLASTTEPANNFLASATTTGLTSADLATSSDTSSLATTTSNIHPDDNKDSDQDGLTDYQEINIYKTDMQNPDTDGDGYKDGDEVKSGYNPLGEGKLIK